MSPWRCEACGSLAGGRCTKWVIRLAGLDYLCRQTLLPPLLVSAGSPDPIARPRVVGEIVDTLVGAAGGLDDLCDNWDAVCRRPRRVPRDNSAMVTVRSGTGRS